MLTLYHAPRSRSFRMLWLLEELGIPYDLKIVSIKRGDGSGADAGDEYRKVHPHAKVPALMHDGVSVFETPAIALYLTDAFPDKGLGPRIGDPLRGPYLSWLSYSTGVIEPSILERVLKIPHQVGTFGWASPDEVEALLEGALSANPYLLGSKFTAADVVVGGSVIYLLQFKLMTPKPMFTAYAERLAGREAYQRAQKKDAG